MESEGSVPERAAFLAETKLSTSSFQIKMSETFKTYQKTHKDIAILYHFENLFKHLQHQFPTLRKPFAKEAM
jgi:hypothetical protein